MSERANSVSDARSSVERALQDLADPAEAQLGALEKCLELIDVQIPPKGRGWAPSSEEEWWWILRRLDALRQFDRVATALKLGNGAFHGSVYSAVRNADLLEIAQAAAANSDLTIVGALLAVHPYSLAPHIFHILSSAPESLPPQRFDPVLRQIVALRAPPALIRPADWIENDSICAALKDRGEIALLGATEQLAQYSFGRVLPSPAQLTQWAIQRAITIDKLTGQLYVAMGLLETVRTAMHFGPDTQPLQELHRAGQQLLMIVKLAAGRGEDAWRVNLGTFAALDDVGKVQALLKLTDGNELADDIPRVILPFLNQLGDNESPGRTLKRALEREALPRLSWVVRFVQAEAQRPAAFESAAEVVSAACAAAYACPSAEAWSLQESLLNAATEAIEGDRRIEPPQAQAMLSTVDQVRGHLTAARLLTKHGLSTSLAAVRDATREDVLNMIRTLLARVSRAKPTESRWGALWTDLRAAQEAGLQALSLDDIRAEVCRALLRNGQVRPAQRHLAALDPQLAEELVLDAARDAFYSEGSPDNAAVHAAQEILKVLPESKAAVEEASFIHAAARLRDLGVDMPPLQLRQAPDKAVVLRTAVARASAKALKDVDGLVELSRALKTGLRKSEVQDLVAEAALAGGQSQLAEVVALQLANERASDGWHIAARVALEVQCSNERVRRRLLAYAMQYAPAEELDGQLHCWKASDAGAAGQPEVWTAPDGSGEQPPYVATLQAALEAYLNKNNASSDDALLAMSSLVALGPEAQLQWAKRVQEHRSMLGPAALRQAYIVGITAASITVLQHAQNLASPAPEEEGTTPASRTRDFLSTKPQYLLTSAVDAPIVPSTDALSVPPSESDTTSLQEERSTGAQHEDSIHASTATAPHSATISALKSLVLDLSQQLVASSDAQRVARLLPGQWAASHWMEGGAEAQRSVVLQLAAAAADPETHKKSLLSVFSGGIPGNGFEESEEDWNLAAYEAMVSPSAAADNDEAPLPSPSRKKSESLPLHGASNASWTELSDADSRASLEQVLTLAQRCGVDEGDVHLAYAAAVIGRRGGGSLQTAEHDLKKVWPAVLNYRPKDAVQVILRQVYPGLDSRARVDRLAWALQLCSEACRRVGTAAAPQAQQAEGEESAAVWITVADALVGLNEAISAIRTACEDADVKTFLDPTIGMLNSWLETGEIAPTVTGNNMSSNGNTSINDNNDAASGVIGQLLEHCDVDNVAALAHAVDAMARNHQNILAAIQATAKDLTSSRSSSGSPMQGKQLRAPYPASSSTAYVAALYRELSAMAIAEDSSADQRQRLETLFAGTTVSDGCATAAFACLSEPTPLQFPSEPPVVLLSPEQALAVLDAVFNAFEGDLTAAAAAAAAAKEELAAAKATAIDLATERTRLSVLLRMDNECSDLMNESQVAQVHALIPQLLEIREDSDTCITLLCDHIAALLADGCPVAAAFCLAEACSLIGPWSHDTVILQAAEGAVRMALSALGGEFSIDVSSSLHGSSTIKNDLSVGDAIQNLYGVIRALDDVTMIASPSQSQLVHEARTVVWELLDQHGAQDTTSSDNAAAAEAHLQVLQMLSSLGSTMWEGWSPPEGAPTGGKFKHTEALLHSRAAAALARTWPTALREAAVTPEDFSSVEAAESAVLKILERANSVEQYTAVASLLSDVLEGAFHLPLVQPLVDSTTTDEGGKLHLPQLDLFHRARCSCLVALLGQGGLDPVIAVLDNAVVCEKERVLVTENEAESIIAAADAALGIVAAATVALLLPYPKLQEREWERIGALHSGEDIRGLSGVVQLAVLVLYRHRTSELVQSNPAVFRHLYRALLQLDTPAVCLVQGSSIVGQMSPLLPPRTGLAVAAASQLVMDGNLQAAAWVAMQHAGTHPFLRILDSGSIVLSGLLRAGSQAGSAGPEIELEPGAGAVLGASKCAEEILRGAPAAAREALQHV